MAEYAAAESVTVSLSASTSTAPTSDADEAQRWHQEIAAAEKWQKRFVTRGEKIIRRYAQRESAADTSGQTYDKSGFNILWANVETLKPILYARTPKPQIAKRNADEDDVGRVASQVLERVVSYNLSAYDFDAQMRRVVTDLLLVGRGQVWVRYVPTIVAGELIRESVTCDAVFWRDFLHSPARSWDEVRWVARRVYMTKAALLERFGARGESVPLDHTPDEFAYSGNQLGMPEKFKRATIWEIWDKDENAVIFIAKGAKDQVIERRPPFISFANFFPCPRPLLATTGAIGGRDDLGIVPSADYLFYQEQAIEIDNLTRKISDLIKSIRMVGVYNAAAKELRGLLSDTTSPNEMIPVENWPFLQQQGGLKGVMDFLPVEQAVGILGQCYQAREQAKAAVYELTGISDIMRGESDAVETATAVQIKSRYGAVRVRERQAEVQRFARDIVRLMGEVIAEVFTPPSLLQQSGVNLLTEAQKSAIVFQQQAAQAQESRQALVAPQPEQSGGPLAASPQNPPVSIAPPPLPPQLQKQLALPTWEQIIGILRDDRLRSFSIDIETDSTVAVDRQQEQGARLEFVRAVNDLMQGAGGLITQAPEIAPLVRELILYAVRSYQVGGELEEVIEQALDAVGQRLAQAQSQAPPGPDPLLQGQQQLEQMKLQLQAQKLSIDQQKVQADAQNAQIEAQLRAVSLRLAEQNLANEQARIAIANQGVANEQARINIAEEGQQNERARVAIAQQKANADTIQAITP